jgi:hypothetical protein
MIAFFVGKLGLKFFPGWVADAHLREVLKEIHIAPDTFDKHHIRYMAEGCVAMARRIGNSRIEPVVLVDLITQAAIGMATEYQCRQINEPDAAIRDLERLRDQAGRQDGENCP